MPKAQFTDAIALLKAARKEELLAEAENGGLPLAKPRAVNFLAA